MSPPTVPPVTSWSKPRPAVPLDALTAEIHATGPDARLTYRSPYPFMIESPDILVRIEGDKVVLEQATGRINHGSLSMRGELDTRTGDARMSAVVNEARIRVDYGLIVMLDTDVEFTWSTAGRGRLAGSAVVERGVLRRDLFLDREVLRMMAESSIVRSDNPLFDRVDLDLRIDTAEGVSIKNNVADIRVNWGSVSRSAERWPNRPSTDASMSIRAVGCGSSARPGGWRRSHWTGTVGRSPDGRVVFEATSSSQDPSLKQKSRGFWYAGLGDQGPGKRRRPGFLGPGDGTEYGAGDRRPRDATTRIAWRARWDRASAPNSATSRCRCSARPTTRRASPWPSSSRPTSPSSLRATPATPRRRPTSWTCRVSRRGPGFERQLFTNDMGNEGDHPAADAAAR